MSSSINQTMAADIKTLLTENQSIKAELAALKQMMAERMSEPTKTKTKKTKKEAEPSAEPKEAKAPSAWNTLVAQTVAEMKESGWPSWTDLKGVVWNASRRGMVKTKGGAEAEAFVFDGGEHDGKPPSPALGGMVRASFLKAEADPSHKIKAEAYHAKLEEKRSAAGSVGEGEKEAPVADAPKKGRKPMTEEAKTAAAAKRAATKAAKAEKPEAKSEKPEAKSEDDEVFTEPVAAPPPKGKKALVAPKPKKVDLSFYAWEHNGKSYIKNDRGDVIEPEEGCWVGRFDGSKIDESIEEPTDLDGVTMCE